MTRYEYKVIAAPNKTKAFKGVRRHEDKFASVLTEIMNEMAASDWEYLRAESLPCEEKSGLVRRVEAYQSVLVFRRQIVTGQKFFDPASTKQTTKHGGAQDRAEQETPSDAGNSVTPFNSEMEESKEPPTSGGVLGILRSRKARQKQASNIDIRPLKLAGE